MHGAPDPQLAMLTTLSTEGRAPAPNRLWAGDRTNVKTHSGWVYVAFVHILSREIVS